MNLSILYEPGKHVLKRIMENWPTHYNDVCQHFINRFDNLQNDLYDRIEQYRRQPLAIDLDPNYDEPENPYVRESEQDSNDDVVME